MNVSVHDRITTMTNNPSQGRTKSSAEPSALVPDHSNPTIDEISEALNAIAQQLADAGAAPASSAATSPELRRVDTEMRIKRTLIQLKETRTELLHIERAIAELALQGGFTLRQVGGPLGVSLSTLSKWKANERFFTDEPTES